MKKQIKLKMISVRPLVFGASLLFTMLVGLLNPGQAQAAGVCYIETGYLRVAPTTTTCALDPSGRIVFLDTNGNSIEPLEPSNCYVGTSSGSGSFATITYRQQSCADLETARASALSSAPRSEPECVARGGTWKSAGTASGGVEYGFYCDNWRQQDQPGDEDNLEIREEPAEDGDCDVNADGVNGDLNAENCGIIAILNTVFNFVSGGVAIAVIGNIIFAGIQYSTAQGDPSTSAKAKKRIANAVLAFVMYLMLFAFIQWLIPGGVFG